MNKMLSAMVFLVCSSVLSACGREAPISETAEAAPPVVETRPGVGHIYGRWAPDPAFCASGERAVDIGEGRFDTANHGCSMSTPEVNGEGWLVTLECSGGSDAPVTERVRLVPLEDKLELNYIDRTQRNDELLVRCPT